jgi:hypothetical protein
VLSEAPHARASQGRGRGSQEPSWLGVCHAGVGAVTTKQRVSLPDGMSLSARAISLSTITKSGQEPECGPEVEDRCK